MKNMNIVTGYSIDEVGLYFSESVKNINVLEPGKSNEHAHQIEIFSGGADGSMGSYNELIGNYTYVCATYEKIGDYDVSYFPLMILQAFYKNDIVADDAIICAKGKEYAASDLGIYVVYESDEVIIYDMRFLVSQLNFKEYIDSLEVSDTSNDKQELDWMTNVLNELIALDEIIYNKAE